MPAARTNITLLESSIPEWFAQLLTGKQVLQNEGILHHEGMCANGHDTTVYCTMVKSNNFFN